MGKLIVIEGTDASGKSTQARLFSAWLSQQGVAHRLLRFPCYDKPSSALVRLYLSGELGDTPDSVNAYAAASFYAVDRYASYKSDWQSYYENGGLLVCDRYTTSNAIHQAGKVSAAQRPDYIRWLYDYEYDKLGIPKPDLVLFLDMPPRYARTLLEQRRTAEAGKTDIHEADFAYLEHCYKVAVQEALCGGWFSIPCVRDGKIASQDAVLQAIIATVQTEGLLPPLRA